MSGGSSLRRRLAAVRPRSLSGWRGQPRRSALKRSRGAPLIRTHQPRIACHVGGGEDWARRRVWLMSPASQPCAGLRACERGLPAAFTARAREHCSGKRPARWQWHFAALPLGALRRIGHGRFSSLTAQDGRTTIRPGHRQPPPSCNRGLVRITGWPGREVRVG